NPFAGLVALLRAAWLSGKTRPMEYRVAQLEALGRFLEEKKQEILEATALDMGKVRGRGAGNGGTRGWRSRGAAGVQGVDVVPQVGNRGLEQAALVEGVPARGRGWDWMSFKVPSTQTLYSSVNSILLPADCFAVVTAGVQETTRLLENKFDYIFFTGIPSMGRLVMAAAAKHLTPVMLELGGKNPCYVSDTCDVRSVARRVAWGRFFNAGQTCVAPDYVLCTLEMQEKLMPALREAITEFYGSNPRESPDFGRIVDKKEFQRLQMLLRSGRVAIGGQTDEKDLYIAPTVVVDVQPSDPIMQEIILGPILPIFIVANVDEAIDFINNRERPLAVYAFSSDDKVVAQVLERTSSGGFCSNDTLMHMILTSLPFGGIGRYHGKFTFDTFSHQRGCLHRNMGLEALNALRYPPYSQHRMGIVCAASRVKHRGSCTLL
ncbi:AL3B1 dehydrogenase, partial [Eolophus roseicapillus]|nr:AL3B1 dehydrogenase [Eolophus roseicapilla]